VKLKEVDTCGNSRRYFKIGTKIRKAGKR